MTPTAPGPGRPTRPAARAVLALVAWTAFLTASAAVLHTVGGPLAPPTFSEPGQLGTWLDQRQPAEAAFAVVRLLALGMVWYLLVVTVAGTVARAFGPRALVRATDAVSVPLVRRLVTGAVGVSMAAVALAGSGGAAAVAGEQSAQPGGSASAGAGAETMRRLPGAIPTAPTTAPARQASGAGTGPPPTMRRLPASQAGTGGGPAAPTVPPATPDVADVPAGRTWRVLPGDHFWSVAEQVLAEAWQRAPADEEVGPYWRALVDANTGVLRDPGNPDLLFADQVIAVPAPPRPRP